MPLQQEYRPKTLKEFIGSKSEIKKLQSCLDREKCNKPHAFLITGNSGCGKTTLSRIIAANYLGVYDPFECVDYNELNTSSFRGIDTARELIKSSHHAPMNNKYKVLMLDEIHGATIPMQEAILKLLEEPPEHIIIILATTNPEKLKTTFKRRCHEIHLNALSRNEMNKLLTGICEKEGVDISKETINGIADIANGSPGIAVKSLDEVIDMDPDEMAASINKAQETQCMVIDLCRYLCNGKKKRWGNTAKILKDLKNEEPESVRRAVMGYCQSVLLNKDDHKIGFILNCFTTECSTINNGYAAIVNCCWMIYTIIDEEA